MHTPRRWAMALAAFFIAIPVSSAGAQLSLSSPLPPSAVLGMRSIDGDVPTTLFWVNTLSYDVGVYWLDYEGAEVFYYLLNPSQTTAQGTYLTHPWIIRNAATGDPLVGFLPGIEPAEADIIDARTSVTPEPASVILMGSGLLGMAWMVSRRRRKENGDCLPGAA